MTTTFSSNLRLSLMSTGSNSGTWGTITNTNLSTILESAIAGMATVTTIAQKQALTVANGVTDESRNALLVLNSSYVGAYEVYIPPVSKLYMVRNANATYNLTIYASTVAGNTTAAGAGVVIPPAQNAFIWCNGVSAADVVSNVADLNVTGSLVAGVLSRGAPVTKTADFSVGATENWLINNKITTACVVTLPAAAAWLGRELMIQNYQALAVTSASSNVVPINGAAAGTAILPAVIGAWAVLVSNGTSWVVVEGLASSFADVTVTGTLNITGNLSRGAPVVKTANFTLAATENWVENNKSAASCVVTLPAASSYVGREVMFKNIQAQTLVSATSNVVPLIGGSAGTAILEASVGAWAVLVSNGTTWTISEAAAVPTTAVGAIKAWGVFDGTAGSPTCSASGNVASITKNGTGDYTVTFTNALSSANYSASVIAQPPAGNNAVNVLPFWGPSATAATPTTTTFRFMVVVAGTGFLDSARITFSVVA